ncbi:UNVERIFIED_CONTAM: hypothetical protein Slati_0887200 [Sesamum latifolium]|uniref:DUF4283 domain-containing protein n=1 Tax=Sesamum latifolium TaxID=2727402 RepID=A0AAW2XPH8_9LAMI
MTAVGGSEVVYPVRGITKTSPGLQVVGSGDHEFEAAKHVMTPLGSQIVGPSTKAAGDGMARPASLCDQGSMAATGLFIGKIPMTSPAMSRDGARRWASTGLGISWVQSRIFTTLRSLLVPLGRDNPSFYSNGNWVWLWRKHKHTQVPVWLRLKHLTVEFWTNEGLSIMASGIGRPLYQDAITKACTRQDFARVCVMLDISSKLPKHVVVMVPWEDGGESPCRVDVEYEWLPPKPVACQSLGHKTAECPDMLRRQPPAVHVFVPKKRPSHQSGLRPHQHEDPRHTHQEDPRPTQQEDLRPPQQAAQPPSKPRDLPRSRSHDDLLVRPDLLLWVETRIIGGKPLHCLFHRMRWDLPWWLVSPMHRRVWALYCGPMLNAAIWNVRGLNRRDHQVAVKDLISSVGLYFVGLLETRVTLPNASRIQQQILPRWKWFVDYNASGNRIWLAWDDEFVDVDIIDIAAQFIHCRIFKRYLHEHVLVTVVYGANDLPSRRDLWLALTKIMQVFMGTLGLLGVILMPSWTLVRSVELRET